MYLFPARTILMEMTRVLYLVKSKFTPFDLLTNLTFTHPFRVPGVALSSNSYYQSEQTQSTTESRLDKTSSKKKTSQYGYQFEWNNDFQVILYFHKSSRSRVDYFRTSRRDYTTAIGKKSKTFCAEQSLCAPGKTVGKGHHRGIFYSSRVPHYSSLRFRRSSRWSEVCVQRYPI